MNIYVNMDEFTTRYFLRIKGLGNNKDAYMEL